MTDLVLADLAIPAADVVPVGGRIGAEIRGLRLGGGLAAPVVAAIEALLLKHKVLFFRDQTHLDDAEQERFGALFGSLAPHPTVGSRTGSAAILELDSAGGGGRADQWHTDVTFVEAYPRISILRGVVIPPAGGDTIWSNTSAAYEALPQPLKTLADGLWAVHSNAYDYASVRPRATAADRRHFAEVFASTVYETEHPLVRVIPETGERTLVLGNFAQRILGLDKADGQALIALFQRHVTAPENTVRWRWRAGDVVLWENRTTQHYAVNDYGDAHRVVRRVTVEGDVSVAVDGRRSTARSVVPRSDAA